MQWHLQLTLRLPCSDTTSCLLGKHNSNSNGDGDGDDNGDGDKSVQIFESLNCILLLFYLLLLLFIIYFLQFHFSPCLFVWAPFGFTFDIFLCTPPQCPSGSICHEYYGPFAMCSSTDRHEIYINLLFIAFDSMFVMCFGQIVAGHSQLQLQLQICRHAATCTDLQRLATCCHLQFCLVFKC